MTSPFNPSPDEPAVLDPRLASLVEAARKQPVPSVRVTVQQVRDGVARRRRAWWVGTAAAAAAVLVGALSWKLLAGPAASEPVPSSEPEVARSVTPVSDGTLQERTEPTSNDPGPGPQEGVPPPDALALAEGIVVRPLSEQRSLVHVEVLGAYAVRVAGGVYRVEVPVDAQGSLLVHVQERILRAEPGSSLELHADTPARFELSAGRARWSDARGGASKVDRARHPSASALALEAEASIAAGDRDEAISLLETLVGRHPRSAAARTGLLDLARLYRAAGQPDRARCAYELYLQRWPTTRLRQDVQRALDKLGSGAACRGLSPAQ